MTDADRALKRRLLSVVSCPLQKELYACYQIQDDGKRLPSARCQWSVVRGMLARF